MTTLHHRLQHALLHRIRRLVATRAGVIVLVSFLLALLSAGYAFLHLRLNGNQDHLVSPEVPFQKTYLQHLENFGDQEFLYVVIEAGSTETGRERAILFAEKLAEDLRRFPDLIEAVHYRISLDELGDGVLLHAPLEFVEAVTGLIERNASLIHEWQERGTIETTLRLAGGLLRESSAAASTGAPGGVTRMLEVLHVFAEQLHLASRGEGSSEPVFSLSTTPSAENYFFTPRGDLLVMKVLPHKDYGTLEIIMEPLQLIRGSIEQVRRELPDVKVGLTGRPALQADEMDTTNRDMTRASIIDTMLVALLFVLIFNGWVRPALIMAALGAAMAWTFGFATVAVGELNLLSVIFALVLVGIGVDYGVHMALRHAEAQGLGGSPEEAVQTAIVQTGPGVVLGVACTVCTFYAVLGSDFRGLAELGLIGGTGILLCLVAMMILLPAMLLAASRREIIPRSSARVLRLGFLEVQNRHPRWVLLCLVGLTAAGIPGLLQVGFSYNLLELQAEGLESVNYEMRLIESADESTWYAILAAEDLQRAESLVSRVKSLPGVGKVESILDFLPADQEIKAQSLAEAAGVLRRGMAVEAENTPPALEEVTGALREMSGLLEGLSEKAFTAGVSGETRMIVEALEHVDGTVEQIERDGARAAAGLASFQDRVGHELAGILTRLKQWTEQTKVGIEDLPASIRSHFVGKDGRLQVKVSPSEDVWDFEKLQAFVSTLRTVDPAVSGVPVTVLEASMLMHSTFLSAAGITVVLVSLVLWVYSRSIKYVLLTLLPLGVGMLWLLELMGWLGLKFNLANFFSLPILIAIGVDGGVHLLDRWQEMGEEGSLFSTSTPTAVASSFITTITGFGGLIFASHQGLASLGAVMVLGSVCGMLACLSVLPCALKICSRSKI